MSRHNEDELIQLAFEDLQGQEQAAAKERLAADPHAQKMMAEYSAMREGLKSLRDIPECQLSTERLRDAILGQGLKPKPRFSLAQWAFAPAAVLLVAFGITMMANNRTSVTPSSSTAFVEKPSHASTDLGPVASLTAPSPHETLVPTPERLRETVQVVSKTTDSAVRSTAKVPAVTLASAPAPVKAPRNNQKEAEFVAPISAANGIECAIPPDSLAMTVTSETSAPIVVIGEESDLETGASRAMEVETPKNVVIGG